MKKLFFSVLFLSIAGMGMVACKKVVTTSHNPRSSQTGQSVLKSEGFNASTDGRLLIFNSLADYECLWSPNEADPDKSEAAVAKFISDLSSLKYSKLKSSNAYASLVSTGKVEEFPSLLFELLNEDGAVQVGNYVFLFDFVNLKGYAIPAANKSTAYNDLVNKNLSDSKVQVYNWEDEMIVWANDPEAKLGCSENQASTTEQTKSYTDKVEWNFLLNGNVFNNQANAAVNYKKFDGELKARYRWTPGGWDLYCKLVLRQKEQNVSGNTGGDITYSASWSTANIPLKLQWQRRYKRKCKPDTGYQQVNNFGTGTVTGQSWYGLKACSKYILGANAYAQINGNWELMAFDNPSAPVNGTLYQVRINQGY